MAEIEVDRDLPSIHNLTIFPDTRASLLIALIAEIAVTGVEAEQHDLALLFLAFRPPVIDTLQRLVPEIVDVSTSLSDAQTFLGLASASERTRSEANKTRVVAAIDARGGEFIRGLERYRLTPDRLENDDQKLVALQNFFDFGFTVY